jgi:hypothetical protein
MPPGGDGDAAAPEGCDARPQTDQFSPILEVTSVKADAAAKEEAEAVELALSYNRCRGPRIGLLRVRWHRTQQGKLATPGKYRDDTTEAR